MRYILLSIFLLSSIVAMSASQDSIKKSMYKKFLSLHCAEKRWVIFHPFKAKKALKITNEALKISKQAVNDTLLDGDANGGQADAFRHGLWMALLAREIGAKAALKLGKAHEKKNKADYKKHRLEDGEVPDSVACEMDLQNNKIGAAIGIKNRSVTKNELIKLIINEIRNGEFYIIKKNRDGKFLDINDNLIPLVEIKGKWNTPKFLVRSNFKKKS